MRNPFGWHIAAGQITAGHTVAWSWQRIAIRILEGAIIVGVVAWGAHLAAQGRTARAAEPNRHDGAPAGESTRQSTLEPADLGLRLLVDDEGHILVFAVAEPARSSGVRPGDALLAINGFEVAGPRDVLQALAEHHAGSEVELIVERRGQTQEIDIPLPGPVQQRLRSVARGVEGAAAELAYGIRAAARDVQQMELAVQRLRERDERLSNGRPRGRDERRRDASVVDPYDRFHETPDGIETDIDDETADFSGRPDLLEIDVIAPDSRTALREAAAIAEWARRASYDSQAQRRAERSGEPAIGIALRSDRRPGVIVAGVHPRGPAHDVGLRPGDRIVGVDGVWIDSPNALQEFVQELSPGDDVALLVERDGRQREFLLMLADRAELLDGSDSASTNRRNADRPQPERRTPRPDAGDNSGDFQDLRDFD